MKMLTGFVLAGSLTIALMGCGGSDDETTTTPPTPNPIPPSLSADICYLMNTSKGEFTLAIDLTNMPITGKNFKHYVDKSFYNGTLFHRTVNNFVIQGGGFTTGLNAKSTDAPIKNEASIGISNKRGTVAMARTKASNSATSQFFINILDNPQLDASTNSYGYAVFGKVVKGMDVVDQISIVPTKTVDGFIDTPVQEIFINTVSETHCSTD
ncbi:Peptidyl-prolyl cis-trans isomerase A precursor [Shewanella putrefaciens]|uniref:peptidylprolyl isomerase n=1 Tax=Shewanella putrefaciens TaxID=24 RepID=UPI000E07C95E|nr:peptidylprolyl isomerase [Shewanella putrefaciens]SUI62834.1 Peptidyl-prolyl cis-trans isomerase A precursor [Shewanella putrefaciens]